MKISSNQNCPIEAKTSFKGVIGRIDNIGLNKINQLDNIIEVALSEAPKLGNNKTTFSFYLTPHGNIGVYCEEKFTPKREFLDVFLKSTVARGDGFVFRKDFANVGEKLKKAMINAVNSCYESKEGRYISKEKARIIEQKAAKVTAKNEKFLSRIN